MSAFETETATKRPVDEHIQNTLLFIQKHEEMLQSFKAATRIASMPFSENYSHPVEITPESMERVLPQDLIFFDNEHVRKALTVLVFLCDEISQLKEISESRFFRPLMMFGRNPPELEESRRKILRSESMELLFDQVGMKEKMIGKFLPFLQELANFIDRCYSVLLCWCDN